jgi:Zn-finger nucleic acid-binding protein
MSEAPARELTCPQCAMALLAEIVGSLHLHRCRACGGVWVDPGSLRVLCEAQAKGGPSPVQEDRADAEARERDRRRVYLRCPVCDDAMSRVNFARVSGVVLDVCRAHGAWIEARKLRALRRVVGGPGLRALVRRRGIDAEAGRMGAAEGGGSAEIDLLDVLAGIPDGWDVPSRRSSLRGFAWAAVLAVAGVGLVWLEFQGAPWSGNGGAAVAGAVALVAAYRAFRHALARRRAQGREGA